MPSAPGSGCDAAPGAALDLAALLASDRSVPVEDLAGGLREEAMAVLRAQPLRISVIMPSWNRAHVIGRAVGSALTQSYAPAEIIVIDDGSTDATVRYLRARFPEAPNLRLIEAPHEGVSAARNRGLEAATGDVVAFLDSDNQWEADHLLFAAAALALRPGYEAVYTGINRHVIDEGWSDIVFAPFDAQALREANFIDLNAYLIRREAAQAIGGFDTALTRLVDWDFILRASERKAPLSVPVTTVRYFISDRALGNISTRVETGPNEARIRKKALGRLR